MWNAHVYSICSVAQTLLNAQVILKTMMEHGIFNGSEDTDLCGKSKKTQKPNNDTTIPPDGGFQVCWA